MDELLNEFTDKNWLCVLLRYAPCNLGVKRVDSSMDRGNRCRQFLLEMGTYYVKLGQALSVRRDFIPADICDELAHLRDACPPFAGEISIALIEQQLGQPINQLFDDFDPKPMASASIAQVHTAKLKDGSSVVVKVVRPDIDKRITESLDSMYAIAKFFDRWFPEFKQLRPLEIVDEFSSLLHNEKDMLREGANANHIRANFEGDTTLYVPKVIWSHTASRVLVLERIYGIPIHRMDRLKKAGIDLKQIADNGVKIFFKQLFEHNLFHADMHPGNVFISEDGKYQAVDYGIVGALSEYDKLYIAENLLAFFNRDYRRIAELHIQSQWVSADSRVNDLESAFRSVSEPIYGKPLDEISFAQYLLRLLQVAREFGMQVQPQLLLLQKTLFNIEGLGRDLYPNLDLWETAKPFLENWVKKQFSPKAIIKDLRHHLPFLREQIPAMLYQQNQSQRQDKERIAIYSGYRKLALSTFFLSMPILLFFYPIIIYLGERETLVVNILCIVLGLWFFFRSKIALPK
jgi:ubiquinone biosynthesis protein